MTSFAERGPGNWTALGFVGSNHGNQASLAL